MESQRGKELFCAEHEFHRAKRGGVFGLSQIQTASEDDMDIKLMGGIEFGGGIALSAGGGGF